MKLLIVLLFLTFSSTKLMASFWYKELEYISMENFTVKKAESKVAISFDYVIKNPNWYNITIKPCKLNLKIADSDCGEVEITDKVNIKRKTKAAYEFVLIADASQFVQSGFSSIWSLLSKSEIDFQLYGALRAGIFGITSKWKMDYTYKMTKEDFLSFF